MPDFSQPVTGEFVIVTVVVILVLLALGVAWTLVKEKKVKKG